MAQSRCQCGNEVFQITKNTPQSSNFTLSFVQCSKCGLIAGVLEANNIGNNISNLEKRIVEISSNANRITNQNIQSSYESLFNLLVKIDKRIEELEKK